MELPPDICFSESELEQAGLLEDTDSCNVASSRGFNFEGSDQQQQCWYTLQSLSTQSCGLANRLQTLAECWQEPTLGAASTASLPTSMGTRPTTLYGDATVQAPPLPQEGLQRRTNFQQQSLAPAKHTANIEEQGRHTPAEVTAVSTRKQANRDYQKKFRARHKARSEATQAQLDATLTQLHDLKLQKLELEQKLQQRVEQGTVGAPPYPDSLLPLTSSVTGRTRLLTSEELTSMPPEQFEKLWADYISEMRRCLSQLNDQRDSFTYQGEARLHQLLSEAFMLAEEVFRKRASHYNVRAMTLCRHLHQQTPGHVYTHLLDLLELSDDQIQDLMFIRQVAHIRNHVLASQCEAVAAKILEDSPTPVVSVNKLSASAVQLQQQALDEHDVALRVKWAIHCGVLTVRQAAHWFIQIGGCREQAELFDYIAVCNGFPSRGRIAANIDETNFDKDWKIFQQYTDNVNPNISWPKNYVPINKHQPPAKTMLLTLY